MVAEATTVGACWPRVSSARAEQGLRTAAGAENKGRGEALRTQREAPALCGQAQHAGAGTLAQRHPCPGWRASLLSQGSHSPLRLRTLCGRQFPRVSPGLRPHHHLFSKSVHPRPCQVQHSYPPFGGGRREKSKVSRTLCCLGAKIPALSNSQMLRSSDPVILRPRDQSPC